MTILVIVAWAEPSQKKAHKKRRTVRNRMESSS
jgi:hypothetical protein